LKDVIYLLRILYKVRKELSVWR